MIIITWHYFSKLLSCKEHFIAVFTISLLPTHTQKKATKKKTSANHQQTPVQEKNSIVSSCQSLEWNLSFSAQRSPSTAGHQGCLKMSTGQRCLLNFKVIMTYGRQNIGISEIQNLWSRLAAAWTTGNKACACVTLCRKTAVDAKFHPALGKPWRFSIGMRTRTKDVQ